MKEIFREYLFGKDCLVEDGAETVNQTEKYAEAFYTVIALGKLFGIKITGGQELACEAMIHMASECIGEHVPDAFYRGFPKSVLNMTEDQLAFDQAMEYLISYGFGHFEGQSRSVLEEYIEREAFKEDVTPREMMILTLEVAEEKLKECVQELLASSRPLNEQQYEVVKEYLLEYSYEVEECAGKNTIVRLLIDTKMLKLADFLKVSDMIKVLDRLNYDNYDGKDLRKLNLRNQDRKFLTKVLDYLFEHCQADLQDCFEKQDIWKGFLHHIHYKAKNPAAEQFVMTIREEKNGSVLSAFEKKMAQGDIPGAVECMRKGKGSGALLRNLDYLLRNCKSQEDVEAVVAGMHTENPVILLQLIMKYSATFTPAVRTFKFSRYNKLVVHTEKPDETRQKKEEIPEETKKLLLYMLKSNLQEIWKGQLGKVYLGEEMKKIALPLQENTSMGGLGVLPKGSRLAVEAGKKIRAFTYWERVDDIDLSVFAINRNGMQKEFSWRTMAANQSDMITFSGDVTRGFNGGAEYFDVDIEKFVKAYPDFEYLVFCDNVFSCKPFYTCFCKAGYMIRDILDSGEIFEPKTVASSFLINCDSTFAYLFALDLKRREFVWLNVARDSMSQVAGVNSMEFILSYMHLTDVMSVYDMFAMMAQEVTENPEEADVAVTDADVPMKEGAEKICRTDVEKLLKYMNMGRKSVQ